MWAAAHPTLPVPAPQASRNQPEDGAFMHADQQLSKSLKPRHLSMIAIAGVIGAGLFVGSGAAIQQAGPGILLAYMAAGIVVILVMRMLGEMAAANPETGSFSTYADKALGRWAGFSIGWLYAWFWIIVLGIEATAGAAIMHPGCRVSTSGSGRLCSWCC